MRFILVLFAAQFSFAATAVPELPRVSINTNVQSTGKLIHVPAGSELAKALIAAQPGDTLLLEPGATYTGAFTLPVKTGEGWITIRSAGEIPAEGTRVSKSHFEKLPKIVTPDSRSAITAPAGAKQYRFIGVEITTTAPLTWNVVFAMQKSQDLIFDRCYIHGTPKTQSLRGIMMDGDTIAVVNSYIDEIHYIGGDSQALGGSSGRGPYKIVNNYIAGAGENIMFGGSRAPAGVTPSDIEITDNFIHKPPHWEANTPTWDGSKWTIKNLFELKHARRVLLARNVLDGVWPHAQTGSALLLTVATGQSGCHAVVSDITIKDNLFRNILSGMSVLGRDYGATLADDCRGISERVLIENNLFVHRPSNMAFHMSWNVNTHNYVLRNNTFATSAPCRFGLFFAGNRATGIENAIFNNVFCGPVLGDATGSGTTTLVKFMPEPAPVDSRYKGNVYMQAGAPRPHPPGNFAVSVSPFVDPAKGDWRLKDPAHAGIGADVIALSAMANKVTADDAVIFPPPPPAPPPAINTERRYGMSVTYSEPHKGYPIPLGAERVAVFVDGKRCLAGRDYVIESDVLTLMVPTTTGDVIVDVDVPVGR